MSHLLTIYYQLILVLTNTRAFHFIREKITFITFINSAIQTGSQIKSYIAQAYRKYIDYWDVNFNTTNYLHCVKRAYESELNGFCQQYVLCMSSVLIVCQMLQWKWMILFSNSENSSTLIMVSILHTLVTHDNSRFSLYTIIF